MLKKNIRKKVLKIRKKNYKKKKINLIKLLKILKKKKLNKPKIGGYFSVNYEIDCLNILKELEKKGFDVCLPRIKEKGQMDFFNYSIKNPLILNKFGIPEPINSKIVLPDVLLVPLVAFDKRKYRIGYGGGFYDRYIQKIKYKKKFLSIGLAFSFQQINKVPNNKFDKKLDLILTDKNIII